MRSLPYLLFVIVCFIGACGTPKLAQDTEQAQEVSIFQRMAITYLSYPQFVHPNFCEQFFAIPLRLQKYQPQAQRLFLSVPKDQATQEQIYDLVNNRDSITFAKEEANDIFLAPYYFEDSSLWYFQFHVRQMKIDSSRLISLQMGDVSYEATIAELADVFSGKMMFNGPVVAQTHERDYQGRAYVVGNHCATIALQGEPSIERLALQLIDTAAPREKQVQALLDFVTRQINYTGDAGMEIFRRPTEVLLSQRADCSGKVVLFASLLAQIDYPYLLVYFPNHIAVAVPGDFLDKNGMHFDHEGTRYYFAETTSKGFWIGQSYFRDPLRASDIKYVQYPGKATKLYDMQRKDSLEFVKR